MPQCDLVHTWGAQPLLPHKQNNSSIAARGLPCQHASLRPSWSSGLDLRFHQSFLQVVNGPMGLTKLQRPDNHLNPHRQLDSKSLFCCGIADTVKTKFKVEAGNERYPEDRWYAWLKEQWVPIPSEKIVQDYAPDGQPYLFLLADTVQCFVRPKGGL